MGACIGEVCGSMSISLFLSVLSATTTRHILVTGQVIPTTYLSNIFSSSSNSHSWQILEWYRYRWTGRSMPENREEKNPLMSTMTRKVGYIWAQGHNYLANQSVTYFYENHVDCQQSKTWDFAISYIEWKTKLINNDKLASFRVKHTSYSIF